MQIFDDLINYAATTGDLHWIAFLFVFVYLQLLNSSIICDICNCLCLMFCACLGLTCIDCWHGEDEDNQGNVGSLKHLWASFQVCHAITRGSSWDWVETLNTLSSFLCYYSLYLYLFILWLFHFWVINYHVFLVILLKIDGNLHLWFSTKEAVEFDFWLMLRDVNLSRGMWAPLGEALRPQLMARGGREGRGEGRPRLRYTQASHSLLHPKPPPSPITGR